MDRRDTYDTRRPYPEGNNFETTGDDAETREVTATTLSDPRRWRVFSLLQTVIIHGITIVAGSAYMLTVVSAVEQLKILKRHSIWEFIIFATLTGISVVLIGIMKQRTPWQIISNFASTFAYLNFILAVINTIMAPSDINPWLATLLIFMLALPLYLVVMIF
jgi:hypothetical protein